MNWLVKGGLITVIIAITVIILRGVFKELDDMFDVNGIDFADVDPVEYTR